MPQPQPARPPARPVPTRMLLSLLLGAIALLHAPTLTRPFFADDYFFLEGVEHRGLFDVLRAPDPLGNFLRPASRQLYFWMIERIAGPTPVVFHALNLILFLTLVALFFQLARRLAGANAAWIAAAFLGFHYAADVPVMWVSGCQDLLALVSAVGALLLLRRGREWWAGALLLFGLLCKESIAPLALIAVAIEAIEYRSLMRGVLRARSLIAATAAWLALWLIAARARPGTSGGLTIAWHDAPAAWIHLLQSALGLEPRHGDSLLAPGAALGLLVLVPAALVVGLSARGAKPGTVRSHVAETPPALATRGAILAGALWALLATAPVVLVLPIWSAYYYLFALLGVALALGAALGGLPLVTRVGLLAALMTGPALTRSLDEFAIEHGAWTRVSHLNRHYLARSMNLLERGIAQLREIHPTLPPRSTVLFNKVQAASGWQAGDGPLLRWVYRDSSLRSYYFSDFTRERAQRGPLFLMTFVDDTLRDVTSSPQVLPLMALNLMLSDKPESAAEALTLALERDPELQAPRYWRVWARWAAGDSAGAFADLHTLGMPRPAPATDPATAARAASARGDSARAAPLWAAAGQVRPLDPEPHAQLAALYYGLPGGRLPCIIEAYAFRVLAPDDPAASRRWAAVLIREERTGDALRALERYMELGGAAAAQDRDAVTLLAQLRSLWRGELGAEALRAK